jgi:hypothetical protein
MTYIIAHLPKLEELKKQLEENPKRIETYMKYMGFEGPDGTIDYITKKIEEHIKNKKNESTKN